MARVGRKLLRLFRKAIEWIMTALILCFIIPGMLFWWLVYGREDGDENLDEYGSLYMALGGVIALLASCLIGYVITLL